MEEQQQSSPSMEKIITSYEETMALATVTNATTIERVGKVQNDINILNKSFNQKTEKIRMMENLLHKLTSECEQIDNSRSENLTRLYDVEKSRDKLKTRLDNSSQALGKEEVSRWKLQTAHDNAIQDADKMQKEVQRLGKLLHEETIIKDDLAEKLNMLQNERSSTDALVHRLREQLKSSMPAAEVQHLLQAAEKRVYEICEGTKKKLAHMQVSLSKTQIENKKLREQVKLNTTSGVSDSKLKDEILLRKRAEKRATEATKRAREMEQRLEFVENETNQLKLMLREAKEGLGVMKTIAKIRGGDNGQGNQSILPVATFDAVAGMVTRTAEKLYNDMDIEFAWDPKAENLNLEEELQKMEESMPPGFWDNIDKIMAQEGALHVDWVDSTLPDDYLTGMDVDEARPFNIPIKF